jgi:N-methylhydantoinase B
VNRPWGIFGGGSGGTSKFVKLSGGKGPLPTKPANLLVTADEAVMVETPGAGGYGKPGERDQAAIEVILPRANSAATIRKNYGVEPKR